MADPSLLPELRQRVSRWYAPLLARLLDRADDALFDLSQKSSGDSEGQSYLDAMRDLRKHREAIQGECASRLNEGFQQLQRSADPARAARGGLGELSLVEAEVLEEQLAGEHVAAAVERRYPGSLRRATLGLGQLLGIDELPNARNPFAPLSLAQAFGAAIQPGLASVSARLVLLKLLERSLLVEYVGLLDEVNRYLGEHGIVVEAPDVLIRQEAEQRAKHPLPVDDAPAAQGAAAPTSAAAGGGQGGSSGMSGDSVGIPDVLFAAMMRLFSAYLGSGEEGGAPRPRDPSRVAPEAVLESLAELQSTPPAALLKAVEDEGVELGELLKNEVVAQAVRQRRAQPGMRLADAEEQGLTLVGMLFDVLLDQNRLARETRERFVRISLPYARVALNDRRLFAQKAHPARRLLNAWAEACDGNRGESNLERELLDKVHAQIDRLARDPGDDPAVFTELEEQFTQIIDQHRKRVALAERRTAEAQRGRERLEEARAGAALALASLIGGEAGPAPIASFLRHEWTHHLTLTLLREGEDSEAYYAANAAGTRLWLAYLACHRGGEPPSPAEIEPLILPAMHASGQDHGACQVLVADILRALAQVRERALLAGPAAAPATADTPGFQIVRAAEAIAVTQGPRVDAEDLVFDFDHREFAAVDVERIRALKVGCWVELVDADGIRQAAKLSWISPISGKLLFVNRRGLRLCALTAEEMAAMMAQDKLVLREVDTAFERAMTHMLGKLHSEETAPAAAVAQPA